MKTLVLYGDGGAHPNNGNGYAGSGIHGYLCTNEKPKSGLGIKQTATDLGYFDKDKIADGANEVTVNMYVDVTIGFKAAHTNNYGELIAFFTALNIASSLVDQEKITKLVFKADSKYVLENFSNNLDKWISNNYCKSNGEEISNKALWIKIKEAAELVKDLGIELQLVKVPAHSGVLGNEMADRHATLGQGLSRLEHAGVLRQVEDKLKEFRRDNEFLIQLIYSDPKGYWKEVPATSPLLNVKQIYFVSEASRFENGVYYFSNNGKSSSDELRGRSVGDSCYGVVKLKEPDPYIEEVRRFHCDVLKGNTDLVEIKNAGLRSPAHRHIHHLFGCSALRLTNRGGFDLQNAAGELTCEVLTKPYLGWHVYDNLENLAVLLEAYLNTPEDFEISDVTDQIYEAPDKKGDRKLKPAFKTSFNSIKLDIVFPDKKVRPITFTANINILARNDLAKLVSLNPKLKVLTWATSHVVNYALVVECDEGVSLWCSVDTNKVYI